MAGLAAAIALVFGSGGTSHATQRVSLSADGYATSEAEGHNLSSFRKWESMLRRYAAEQAEVAATSCQPPTASIACRYKEWERFLNRIRGFDRRQQLEAVNREVNSHPYVSDQLNWGVEDYWATPGEFMSRTGDCEDYAILKFLSLRRLGWTGNDVRLAAVMDMQLQIGHAVVIAQVAGKTWLLDNQIPTVVEARSIAHYQPVYSLTETAWWLHRSPQTAPLPLGQRPPADTNAPHLTSR